MFFMLASSRMWLWRKSLLRFRDFLAKIWLPKDLEYFTFPEPVFLNRLAAARLVLIFGIFPSPLGLLSWGSRDISLQRLNTNKRPAV